jgi:hypothetical protein
MEFRLARARPNGKAGCENDPEKGMKKTVRR